MRIIKSMMYGWKKNIELRWDDNGDTTYIIIVEPWEDNDWRN